MYPGLALKLNDLSATAVLTRFLMAPNSELTDRQLAFKLGLEPFEFRQAVDKLVAMELVHVKDMGGFNRYDIWYDELRKFMGCVS